MLISAQQMWDDLSRHHNGTALELVEFEDTQISCDGVKGVDLSGTQVDMMPVTPFDASGNILEDDYSLSHWETDDAHSLDVCVYVWPIVAH